MDNYLPQDALWAINDVLKTKTDTVQPAQIGARRMKIKIEAMEKLVRIQAAIFCLGDPKMIEAIRDEAYNRIMVAEKHNEMTGNHRKPWQ